jgi:hypothetical protein
MLPVIASHVYHWCTCMRMRVCMSMCAYLSVCHVPKGRTATVPPDRTSILSEASAYQVMEVQIKQLDRNQCGQLGNVLLVIDLLRVNASALVFSPSIERIERIEHIEPRLLLTVTVTVTDYLLKATRDTGGYESRANFNH